MPLQGLLEVDVPQIKVHIYVRCVVLDNVRPAHPRLSLRALKVLTMDRTHVCFADFNEF